MLSGWYYQVASKMQVDSSFLLSGYTDPSLADRIYTVLLVQQWHSVTRGELSGPYMQVVWKEKRQYIIRMKFYQLILG